MIPTSQGEMTPASIIDLLNYANYKANRGYGMTAEKLKKLWPQSGDAMEAKYQTEQAIEKARAV